MWSTVPAPGRDGTPRMAPTVQAFTLPAPGRDSRPPKADDRERSPKMPRELVEFRLGDIVRLRKPHPCGGYEWRITRLGADIGLRCQTCSHRVLLERAVLEKRLKTFVLRGEPET